MCMPNGQKVSVGPSDNHQTKSRVSQTIMISFTPMRKIHGLVQQNALRRRPRPGNERNVRRLLRGPRRGAHADPALLHTFHRACQSDQNDDRCAAGVSDMSKDCRLVQQR